MLPGTKRCTRSAETVAEPGSKSSLAAEAQRACATDEARATSAVPRALKT